MDQIHEIELEDCPICRGIGTMEDEAGWCVYVSCLDCGAQTAHVSYNTPEERHGRSAASCTPLEHRQGHSYRRWRLNRQRTECSVSIPSFLQRKSRKNSEG